MLRAKPLDLTWQGEGVCIQVMSSVSKPRVRQNRHKQGLNQTLEKYLRILGIFETMSKNTPVADS